MTKEKVVFTSGSWDMFHVGHLNVIRRSRELGDRLVVGVSSDELIAEYKGAPPVIPFEERLEIVANVKGVHLAVRQTILTEIRQLREHSVDIVTIGDDWKDRYLEGLEWMKEHGEVVYLPYTAGVSTTSIKRKIIENIYSVIAADLRREMEKPEEWKQKQLEARKLKRD